MFTHRILPLALAAAALLCRGGDDVQQRIVGRTFGDTPLLHDLEELCDRVGGRPTRLPACVRAIEWGAGKIKAAGAAWTAGTTEAECVAPETFAIRLSAAPYSLPANGVRVRLRLDSRLGGAFASRNVIADLRGRERPDEIVLLGAHLDSWGLGTGADDNGANVALVIDALRAIKELRVKPRLTIRFALFTGEEQGLWGSTGYIARHAKASS